MTAGGSSRPIRTLVDCGQHLETADSAEAGDAREIERRYRALVEQLPLVVYVDALDVLIAARLGLLWIRFAGRRWAVVGWT